MRAMAMMRTALAAGLLSGTGCLPAEVAFPCDGIWYADMDDDGYGAPETVDTGCPPEGFGVAVAGDCDDGDPTLHPETTWYEDADGDGAADQQSSAVFVGCEPPEGYTRHLGDADDTDPEVR